MNRNLCPKTMGHTSIFGHLHFTIHHIPQYALPIMNANRDEIRAGLRIIIPFQSYGPAVVFL